MCAQSSPALAATVINSKTLPTLVKLISRNSQKYVLLGKFSSLCFSPGRSRNYFILLLILRSEQLLPTRLSATKGRGLIPICLTPRFCSGGEGALLWGSDAGSVQKAELGRCATHSYIAFWIWEILRFRPCSRIIAGIYIICSLIIILSPVYTSLCRSWIPFPGLASISSIS